MSSRNPRERIKKAKPPKFRNKIYKSEKKKHGKRREKKGSNIYK